MRFLTCLLLLTIALTACDKPAIKVACIGDSITEGSGLIWESRQAYPVFLGSLLGPDYEVLNCGRSSATMLKDGNYPIWGRKDFSNVFVFKPDIITIKLGTNDTKPFNWNAKKYERDYQAMIDTLLTLPGPPQIYCCLPVPVFVDRWGINDSTLVSGVIPIIRKVAAANNLPVIDLYTPLLGEHENFPDHIHPDGQGALSIARVIANSLKRSD